MQRLRHNPHFLLYHNTVRVPCHILNDKRDKAMGSGMQLLAHFVANATQKKSRVLCGETILEGTLYPML